MSPTAKRKEPGTPRVYIGLLNYGGTDDTLRCLDSLKQLDYPNYEVLVVDNASPDDSAARLGALEKLYPQDFRLIVSPENLGFSGGNNLAIRYALDHGDEVDFFWLLNNDTTVARDALRHLVAEAQRTGGLAGSLLRYPDGRYQVAGTRINWWTGSTKGYREEELEDGMPLETLPGASVLVPLEAFRRLGPMDESYFLYFEDGEFSLRCARAGYPLTLAANSTVYHVEGATTGSKSLRTQYYYHRNRLKLLYAYAGTVQKITIGAYAIFRLLRSGVKSALSPEPERKQSLKTSLKVQWLALKDFAQGVDGPCPHDLNAL